MRQMTSRYTISGLLVGLVCALVVLAGPPARAQVAVDDTILLDPFDPVPEIQFRHFGDNGCYEGCGYHRYCGGCERTRCWRDGCGRLHCRSNCRHEIGCREHCRDERARRFDHDAARVERDHRHFQHDEQRFREDTGVYEEEMGRYHDRYGHDHDGDHWQHDWHDAGDADFVEDGGPDDGYGDNRTARRSSSRR